MAYGLASGGSGTRVTGLEILTVLGFTFMAGWYAAEAYKKEQINQPR